MRAGIAFGSNLGDRLENLREARARVLRLPGVEPPWRASALYETEPVECEPGAARFFNAVLEIGYEGAGEDLLRELREIERALGRAADHPVNTSRTLDLDLLYFGDLKLSLPDIELPHPRMFHRRFVLEPLAEIRPELILPGQSETVAALLQHLPDSTPLVRNASQW